MNRFVFSQAPRAVAGDLARLRADLAALRMRWALVKLAMKHNFDPGQPRVPAGSSDGGRWTEWVRVAANDRGAGGIATDATTRRLLPKKLRRVDSIPPGAETFVAPDGTKFLAPAMADFEKVYASGQTLLNQNQKDWISYINDKVGQFGEFDFQRSDGLFYSQYTNASNYAAGLFMSGAGFSYRDTIAIAGGYAISHSSGGVTANRIRWWTYGYLAGYLRAPLTPLPSATKAWLG